MTPFVMFFFLVFDLGYLNKSEINSVGDTVNAVILAVHFVCVGERGEGE